MLCAFVSQECVCYRNVQSCPKSEEEWKEASRLNCQKNDEYHCVRDALKTKLISLCTPNIPILGKHCVDTVNPLEDVDFVCGYSSPANVIL